MLPKETAELYMSIQAPDRLKDKILEKAAASQEKSRSPWKSVLTAACLMLVIASAAIFLQKPAADLLLYENAVGNSPVAVTAGNQMARAISDSLEISLETREDAEVTVSRGEIKWTEDNGDAFKSFIWLIPLNNRNKEEARLTVTINQKETIYSLFADNTGNWYLAKAE